MPNSKKMWPVSVQDAVSKLHGPCVPLLGSFLPQAIDLTRGLDFLVKSAILSIPALGSAGL